MAEEAKRTKKVTTVKNLKKWEAEFHCKFSYDLSNNKVYRIRCDTCCRFEGTIKSTKNFSTTWITASESISKDSVSKQLKSEQHKLTIKKQQQSELGADVYRESVIANSVIAKNFLPKLSPKDRAGLRTKVNTVYHLIKNERPFTDYPKLLELQKKNCVPELLDNQIFRRYATDDTGALFGDYIGEVTVESFKKDFVKATYYSVLTDGSINASIIEEEATYVLFLDDGIPKTEYFSIENVKHGNAEGLHDAIKTAFERFGIKNFEKSIVGLNCDGANVNMGINNGLGKQVKNSAPWLELVHCFNHRIELALKDAFEKTFFSKIENMLTKLYYLYQKIPKRYRELRKLSEDYEKTIIKPAKAHGTGWIGHKFRAMT